MLTPCCRLKNQALCPHYSHISFFPSLIFPAFRIALVSALLSVDASIDVQADTLGGMHTGFVLKSAYCLVQIELRYALLTSSVYMRLQFSRCVLAYVDSCWDKWSAEDSLLGGIRVAARIGWIGCAVVIMIFCTISSNKYAFLHVFPCVSRCILCVSLCLSSLLLT